MDRIEAMTLLSETKHYLTAGNPVWDVDEIAEACDMAIEALRNEINCVKCEHYTERETYTGIKGVCKIDTAHREDLISRQDAIEAVVCHIWHMPNEAYRQFNCENVVREVVEDAIKRLPSAETLQNLLKPNNGLQGSDLISRTDAIRWVKTECNPYGKPTLDFESGKKVIEHLEQMPSADEQDDNRLYIKIYANDEPSRKAEKLYQICGETESQEVAQWLKEYFPSADRSTEWIPFKKRPLTDEEKEEYPDWVYIFDCPLPDDEEEILLSNGKHVWTDTFIDDGECYLDGGDDIDEGMAWMPMPEPWKDGE